MEYELVDQGGQVTRKRYELNAPADYDAAVASEALFRVDLLGVTDAVIKSYRVYREFYESVLSLPASAQNENQAVLLFQLANPLETGRVTIPAPAETIFAAASGANNNIVDVNDAFVTDFAADFISVAGGGNGMCLISDGEVSTALLKGHRRHVKKTLG